MHHHRVSVLCQAMDVSRSGFYDWNSRPESARCQQNQQLLQHIRKIHSDSREHYGAVKVWQALRDKGEQCGLHRVERLRSAHGIEAKRVQRSRAAYAARNNAPAAPNILNRAFDVRQPNRVWVGDITFIATRKGWLYLAIILDLYSRQIVGWAMSQKPDRYLVKDALLMAIRHRKPKPGLIHHTDQGIQYASSDYQALLKANNMIVSMSRKGNCHDNAVAESFFSNLKNELICHRNFANHDEARSAIFDYIEVFYNRQRIHQTLGYKTPIAYEMMRRVA